MKIGFIDVGGGFRGIYACGVLDEPQNRTRNWLLGSEKNIPMRPKSCVRGQADTMKALRWHRNMQNKEKC